VYVAEGIGSLAGGVLFTFVLAGRVDAFTTALLSAAILLTAVGAATLCETRHRILGIACLGAAVIAALLPAVRAGERLNRVTAVARWSSAGPGVRLIEERDSIYQHIAVAEREGQYTFFGNGAPMLTFPDEYEAAQVAHLVMAEHPSPKTVLVVGSGLEGIAGEILKYPVARLDFSELDPEVTNLLRDYMGIIPDFGTWLADRRLRIHHEEGRRFIMRSRDTYDIVFLNVPDPDTAAINRYYTEEFYRRVRGILNPGGVVAARVGAPSSTMFSDAVKGYSGSVWKTMKKVFAHVAAAPGEVNYFFASDSPEAVTTDAVVLADRYRKRGVSSAYFAPEVYSAILIPQQVRSLESILRDNNPAPVNTDLKPITYFYGLAILGRYAGSGAGDSLLKAKMSGIFVYPLLAGWILLAIVAAGSLRNGNGVFRRRAYCLLSVGTTGFAAIAAELFLMLAFQSFRGYVYNKVGLLIGVFMGALALGGALTAGWISRRRGQHDVRRLMRGMLLLDLSVLVFAAAIPLALRIIPSGAGGSLDDVPFYALAAIAGILTGATFPLANAVFQSAGTGGAARSSGLLGWADHFGATAGALLTGVVLIPFLGIAGACLAVAAVKLVALAGLTEGSDV
jgi:spermidine synthase